VTCLGSQRKIVDCSKRRGGWRAGRWEELKKVSSSLIHFSKSSGQDPGVREPSSDIENARLPFGERKVGSQRETNLSLNEGVDKLTRKQKSTGSNEDGLEELDSRNWKTRRVGGKRQNTLNSREYD